MLVLLDIDGTLLLGRPVAHAQALARAIGEAFGVEATEADLDTVGPAGRTDQEIARLVARALGVGEARIGPRLPLVMRLLQRHFAELEPTVAPQAVAPGAAAALARLHAAGASLALLTGNARHVARAKMARAGLADRFPVEGGAYGCDHERRDALVPIAAARAGGAAEVVVVGDTPRDVACARAGGARCVAVTTGAHDARALAGADAVVGGLEEAAEVIAGWLAGYRDGPMASSTRS